MKNKILIFIIGILMGAIITTSAFLIYNKTLVKNSTNQEVIKMNRDGQSGPQTKGNMGEPPERPNQNERTHLEIPSTSNNNI